MGSVHLSVVLPVYNEEESITLAYTQVKVALDKLHHSYEVIFVDDGSKDRSFEQLAQIAENDAHVTVIRFRRNYGQTAALSAGIDRSQGDIIVLMDADLQNDPEDIKHLLDKMDEGFDVVSGWRKDRQDANLKRKIPSKIANGLISRVTGVHLHDYGCTLKAYRREVLEPVRLYGEMHRFIPAYAYMSGARVTEIPVNHRARQYGQSKYGLSRIFRVILDLITVKFLGTYSTKPIYAFGAMGLLMSGGSAIAMIVAIWQAVFHHVRFHNNPLTLMGAVFFVLAIQTIMMGLLAEMMMRTYFESQGKATYNIRTVLSGARSDPSVQKSRLSTAFPNNGRSLKPVTPDVIAFPVQPVKKLATKSLNHVNSDIQEASALAD